MEYGNWGSRINVDWYMGQGWEVEIPGQDMVARDILA